MLKFDFEDTLASPAEAFGWCPLHGTMLGPQCLLLTQLRITFAPQNSINSLETNWSLRCNRHRTIILWFPYFPLRTPFSWWHSVDVSVFSWCATWRMIVSLCSRPFFLLGLLHSCHMTCLNLSETLDPLRHWPYWFAYGLGLCFPNRLGRRAKRKQFVRYRYPKTAIDNLVLSSRIGWKQRNVRKTSDLVSDLDEMGIISS